MDATTASILFNSQEDVIINKYSLDPNQKRPVRQDEDLTNERVRFPEVLVIGPNGDKLGVMSSKNAQAVANQYDLDLVCVSPNGNPPVCKILNYGKYRFEKQKKAKENKKKQKVVETKEIQLTPQIGDHDMQTKARHAIGFLQDGNRIKVGVRFRGRQLAHVDVGEETLNKFIELVNEYAVVDKPANLEGKWLTCFLAPKTK